MIDKEKLLEAIYNIKDSNDEALRLYGTTINAAIHNLVEELIDELIEKINSGELNAQERSDD